MAVNTPNPAQSPAYAQKGTGFVNLQKYLQAGSGAKLGQNIGGQISNLSNQTSQGLGDIKNQFSQDVSKSVLSDEDKQRRESLLGNALQGQAPQSDADVKQFDKYRQGEYSGPTDLTTGKQAPKFTNLLGSAAEAQQLGEATKTGGGREALLQSFVKGPNYNQGQRRFDSLLLGSQGGQALNQARKSTLGLQQQAQQTQTNAAQQADLAKASNKAFGAQTRQELGIDESGNIIMNTPEQGGGPQAQGAFGQVYNPLQQKLAAAPDLQKQYEDFANTLNSGDFGAQKTALEKAGIDTSGLKGYEGFYGVSPTAYLQNTAVQPTLENVASQQDYAKLNALAKLSGADQNLLQDPSKATPIDQLKAYQFAQPQFNQAVTAQHSNYLGAYNPAVQGAISAASPRDAGNFGGGYANINDLQQSLSNVNKARTQYGLAPIDFNSYVNNIQGSVGQGHEQYAQAHTALENYLKTLASQGGQSQPLLPGSRS